MTPKDNWWHLVWLAFIARGPYDPSGRDQEAARLRDEASRSLLLAPPGETPDGGTDLERHSRYTLALIRAHHRVYRTWPDAATVERALDVLGVPHAGTVLDEEAP